MHWKDIKKRLKNCDPTDYFKSVYANKFALTGYISAAASVAMICTLHADPKDLGEVLLYASAKGLTGIYAILSLQQTFFGATTWITYSRTKNHIKNYGKVPEEYSLKGNSHYCDEVGIDLAVKEAGLEGLLK